MNAGLPIGRAGFACRAEAAELYVRGLRVGCARITCDAPLSGEMTALIDRAAEASGLPLAMILTDGPAPDGWITVPRGLARPLPAPPEALEPLTMAHHAAMRGLHGLYAGRFSGMFVREDPEAWAARLTSLTNPLGLFEDERLLAWLAAENGALVELAAAPDALLRIPGALIAAGVTIAPAPVLGVPPEALDQRLKLRLLKPLFLPGGRIETPEQLARTMDGAVQWDE